MNYKGRCLIIAECATNHGGDMVRMEVMIKAAADNGADYVKFQAYDTNLLKGGDPQYEWFQRCLLTPAHIKRIMTFAVKFNIKPLFTVFDARRLAELAGYGLTEFKVGHGDSHKLLSWDHWEDVEWFAAIAWGQHEDWHGEDNVTAMATAPLYPAPLSSIAALGPADGYSDHCEGMAAVYRMVARGAKVVEKHFHVPGIGCREQSWNMTPSDLAQLRKWAEDNATMTLGTEHFNRWRDA